jgi:hypothetical protein
MARIGRLPMINARGLMVVGMVGLALTAICRAAESPSKPLGTYDCRDIRRAVALFPSVWVAEKAARAAGASDRQIAEARKCLSR